MKILGIDPGKTTGWAIVEWNDDKSYKDIFKMGESRDVNLLDLTEMFQEADQVVFENFLVRPGKARDGSFDWDPMITPQVIGSVKLLCRLHDRPIAEQSPSVKPPGYGFAGIPYKKAKKGVHIQDAIAHAFFFAVKNAGLRPNVI